jgi:spore coat protein U-like protein
MKIKQNLSKKTIALSLVSALCGLPCTFSYATGSSAANVQSTATISSVCTIAAQNLSFGNLVLPLSAQSASTSMSVLCSNKASYTVGLTYGGVYGTGGVVALPLTGVSGANGYALCTYSAVVNGTTVTRQTNNSQNCYTTPSLNYTVPSYAYGKMIGSASGDNVAYSIQVPDQPTKVWNAGNSSYTATGTGVSQTLPVVGTIVPSQSGSNYPTPDTYSDTVVATVSF